MFDEAYWTKVIKRPDWYLEFVPYTKQTLKAFGSDQKKRDEFSRKVRHFFEDKLEAGQVTIASSGPDLDAVREEIDTVVIHHTSHTPGYRLTYLNAVHLLNIYAPYFANPALASEKNLKGQAIWSGHFYQGRQVFWGYHWLMRMDGSFERLLEDSQIGWQAGNWDINTRSVGICLDNDYENHDPEDEILANLASHIKKHYPDVKIIGHCEAREATVCPGTNFMNYWKPLLLEYLG